MRTRVVADVSALPEYGFDAKSPMWWGTLGFIAIEGTGFALVIGVYFYLRVLSPEWPIAAPLPKLWPGTASLVALLLSLWPNALASHYAKVEDLGKCRLLLVVMSAFGLVPLVIRIFEFDAFGLPWNANAYGSIVWTILGLHTLHLLTDVADTLVVTALMFTRHGHGKRFSDITDNAFYWGFVVASWVLLYGVLYWAPRL